MCADVLRHGCRSLGNSQCLAPQCHVLASSLGILKSSDSCDESCTSNFIPAEFWVQVDWSLSQLQEEVHISEEDCKIAAVLRSPQDEGA